MKKHIICLGDSNTHGYCADCADCADPALARFNENERWTCLLQRSLGEDYLVVEEGLSGRTTAFDDPLFESLSALDYIAPCLKSHEPVRLLIIMLGTNDTKERFAANAFCIGLGMRRLIHKATSVECWGPGCKPNILIVSPPSIEEGILTHPLASGAGGGMGQACVEKSKGLSAQFNQIARDTGCHFLDAHRLGCKMNLIDFMHLTSAGHRLLAETLAKLVPTLV